MVEMRHAEEIAERLNYFGVVPTIKPNPIAVGGDAQTMIRADIKAEEEAITLYKAIIKQAASEGDETTRLLFEEILSVEEDHHDTFPRRARRRQCSRQHSKQEITSFAPERPWSRSILTIRANGQPASPT